MKIAVPKVIGQQSGVYLPEVRSYFADEKAAKENQFLADKLFAGLLADAQRTGALTCLI